MRTEELFRRYGLPFQPEQKVKSLRAIDKVLLQLVRLADLQPKMLVINNLSFICNKEDMERLLKILGKIREAGISMLVYDSNPNCFVSLADHILLVKKGQIVKKFYDREAFEIYWEHSSRSIPERAAKKEPQERRAKNIFAFPGILQMENCAALRYIPGKSYIFHRTAGSISKRFAAG